MTRWARRTVLRRCAKRSRGARAIAAAARNRSNSSPSPRPFPSSRSGRPSRSAARRGSARIGCRRRFPKWRELRERAASIGKAIELHLIGPLQSNKAREAVENFDVIETVDREKIAAALAREIQRLGKHPHLFVEVNTGGEPQKAGVPPEDADAFLALCRDRYGLTIEGLMAIPPAGEQVSPHFALLGVIAARNGISELSMGMSADWPLAVQLGATYVRVGSAIFGARDHG